MSFEMHNTAFQSSGSKIKLTNKESNQIYLSAKIFTGLMAAMEFGNLFCATHL